MKGALKWVGIIIGGIVVVAAIAAVALYARGRARLDETYVIAPEMVPIADDEESLARGAHLVTGVSACGDCHGDMLGGDAFFEDPIAGTVSSSNLTAGEGGVATEYEDEDWVRAIRHGVGPDNRPLVVMPAHNFHNMSAEDLGAVITYVKEVPPVDNVPPPTDLTPLAYVLLGLGQLDDLIPAELIDHDAPLPEAPPAGATQAYGAYLVNISTCRDCHGTELAGGQAGPGEPIGPNLTPAGRLSEWNQADFVRLMREGRTPADRQIDEFMPWRNYRRMSDEELEAMWLYLESLEPVETPAEFADE